MVLMTEQTDRATPPLSSPEGAKIGRTEKKDPRLQTSLDAENVEKQKRGGKSGFEPQLAIEVKADLSESRLKSPNMRIKPVDQASLLLSPADCESKMERKKSQYSQATAWKMFFAFSKANGQYHKLFKEISKDEILQQSYTCALQKDILYQGKLFVSDNWICFYSKVFGRDTKIAIPVVSVTHIKKTKTALLVPNALIITTLTSERHLFVSFLSRDTTYKILLSVCVHLHRENAGSTPVTSSAENSFRGECPSSLPLDFSADFSDLDGVVRQRRQDMTESSSSGSQTPDYEKMSEFPLSENFLDVMKTTEMAVHADIHLQTSNTNHHSGDKGDQKSQSSWTREEKQTLKANIDSNSVHSKSPENSISDTTQQEKMLHPVSLNTLLLLYLFLVCILVLSSCYMAFKILALEQRLNSLGAAGDYSHDNALYHQSQPAANAEMYVELTSNLFKLEKIQKNLQKLLEGS